MNSAELKNKISLRAALKEVIGSNVTRILIGLSMIKSLVSIVYCLLMPFLWKQIGYGVFEIGIIISVYTRNLLHYSDGSQSLLKITS